MLTITIPFKTPTINHMYGFRGYRKFFTKEGKLLRKRIEDLCAHIDIDVAVYRDQKLSVSIEVHENWFTKKGNVAHKDIDNRSKFIQDSIFGALDLNDMYVFDHRIVKVQDDVGEYTIVRIDLI